MFGFFNRRRREALQREPLPDHWNALLAESSPLFRRMPDPVRLALLQHARVFQSEKQFEGCNGLELTEAMTLLVSAHACLPLLGRDFDYYPYLQSVLIYPEAFVVEHEREDEFGFVDAEPDVLEGESWDAGAIVLSWEDVETDVSALDGRNVIVHEMAHQIFDHEGLTLETAGATETFHEALQNAFKKHVRAVDRGRDTVIDPYGAEDPAEFFSVLSEMFYEAPQELRAAHPQLYDGMRAFYGVNPSDWQRTETK